MTGQSPLARLADRVTYALDFLRRLDLGNGRMLTNALSIMARPGVADWVYNRDLVRAEVPQFLRNFVLDPDEMNEFQRHAPVSGYTSTPEDGLLAGFTDRGRLSTLFWPQTGFSQQIPYYETGSGRLNGAKPREGGFLGVRRRGEVTWSWESQFTQEMRVRTGTNILESTAESDALSVTETAYVVPDADVLFRDFEVTNHGERSIDRLVYYTQANVSDRLQYPPGITSRNHVRAVDGELSWQDANSDLGLSVMPVGSGEVVAAGVADAPLAQLFRRASRSVTADHVGGYLETAVAVAPGETTRASFLTTGRRDFDLEESTLSLDPETRRDAVSDWWQSYLEPVDRTLVPDDVRDQYVRSLVGMAMLADPSSGSISAAPNFQPTYYFSWPRDGALVAKALARAGLTEPAARYLAEFLPRVQEADGGFQQCYASNGQRAGIIHRENDQQPIFVHAVRAVYEETGDEFLEAAWPAVEAALEYTMNSVVDNGLLAATHDYAEMWTNARQSLWTNAFAYRALLDGAYLAEQRGERGDRYRDAAERMGRAIEDAFVGETFVTELTIRGPECDPNPAFSVAIEPTGWAGDHGHADELLDFFERFHHEAEGHWLPREFMYAVACFAQGDRVAGDRVLRSLAEETLPGGTFAEEVAPDGNHRFAALGWSNAAFVSALHERGRHVDPSIPVGE